MAVPLIYSARYHIDIGFHVFPTNKYQLIHERLRTLADDSFRFVEPDPAPWEDLALVHTPDYLNRLRTGTMAAEEVA